MSNANQQFNADRMQELAYAIVQAEVTFASNKADKRETVQVGSLPESSIMAILRYGAQRFINDKLGGADVTQAEAEEKFSDIMSQLREGWVDRRGQGGGTSVDPIEREMAKLARERVKAALKAKGIPLKEVSKEKMADFIQQVVAKSEKDLRAKAEQIVAAKNTKLEIDDIDLGDLA